MSPVVVLGAGINGAAVARELAINGVPVWLIDQHDIAYGATARSSRLIHGGLRYLEYRDFRLVKESLIERESLLKTAPQFVTPLRLRIPVKGLFGGLAAGALKFCGLNRFIPHTTSSSTARGMLAVSFGLEMYDWLAGRSLLPSHQVVSTQKLKGFAEDRRWVCEYSDCQMLYPERFVLALLADAGRAAAMYQQRFEVRTHCSVAIENDVLRITSRLGNEAIEPAFVINASGAWGDVTLRGLGISSPQLFAGTKGAHLLTFSPSLRQTLDGYGIYAEAADGRLVFILPCGAGTLIGTTDIPFTGNPAEAIATDDEVQYLISMVNSVLPQVKLTVADIAMRHAGVRPLPNINAASTAAIPRGHSLVPSVLSGIPTLTLVGGKLTTCRALAEQVGDIVMKHLNYHRRESSARRLVPGAEKFPQTPTDQDRVRNELSTRYQLTDLQVSSVWSLLGLRFTEVFAPQEPTVTARPSLIGTSIPMEFVKWSIAHEWAVTLSDLVERRLMLIFQPSIRRDTLQAIANELVAAEQLSPSDVEYEIEAVQQRLHSVYGITLK